jgi:chemotaxis protein CheZ
MSAEMEAEQLKSELFGLFKYVQRVREEIAAMARPADEDYQFTTMGEQLDIIVKATEEATHTIMGVVEKNDALIEKLQGMLADDEAKSLLDEIVNNNMQVIQACSFQDLTGQRVNKVIKSLSYVETRVNNLADVWGKDELAKVEVQAEEKSEDEKLLHGPQDPGRGISQDEIDALFD